MRHTRLVRLLALCCALALVAGACSKSKKTDLGVNEKGKLEVTAQTDVKLTSKTGTITIEATAGQIKANGKAGVEISASGPLKITSTAPVTIESNAALQLKGSVVQVQASGVLQLSGATVMIG